MRCLCSLPLLMRLHRSAARLLVGGSAAAQVLGRVAGQGVESLPSAPLSPQRPTPARAVLPAPPVAESGGVGVGLVAGAKGPGPGVDRSGPVPSASELIASLNAMSVSRGVAARSGDPSSGGNTGGTEVPAGAYRALEPRNYMIEEIRQFDGGNPGDPIFLLCRGNIFDVSSREDLYGISGPYNYMAGRDASRILAKMARKGQETETVSLDDLSETELKTLQQWEDKFRQQYPIVGYLKGPSRPVSQIDVW